MRVQLKNVVANPFRDIDSYPIERHKVEALKKSIKDTEFWDNIVARRKDGQVQIAYGHHRLTALKELYPGTHEISLITKTLDDGHMIKIMANENMEEWGHDAGIMHETIKAIVHAYSDGKIILRKPPKDSRLNQMRFAPSFCYGQPASNLDARPYTADTVANFLGWQSTEVKYALRALCLIEQKHATEKNFHGITMAQSRHVVEELTKAIKQAEVIKRDAARQSMSATPARAVQIEKRAKEQAKQVVAKTRQAVNAAKGEGARSIKEAGLKARAEVTPKDQQLPDISNAAGRLSGALTRYLDPDSDTGHKLSELVKYKKHLSSTDKNNLTVALNTLIEYAEGFRTKLK